MESSNVCITNAGLSNKDFAAALQKYDLDYKECSAGEVVSAARHGDIGALVIGQLTDAENRLWLCRRLKLDDEFNHIPVLAITSGSPPRPPTDHVRIEPDEYVPNMATEEAVALSAYQALLQGESRRNRGTKFYTQAVSGSDLRLLPEVGVIMETMLALTSLPDEESRRLRYAVLEMGSNAIEWGNRGELRRGVYFKFLVTNDRIEVKIRDSGGGFDAEQMVGENVPEPEEQMRIREDAGVRLGGYGVRVCQEFVDGVTYNDRGNEVALVKELPGADPE